MALAQTRQDVVGAEVEGEQVVSAAKPSLEELVLEYQRKKREHISDELVEAAMPLITRIVASVRTRLPAGVESCDLAQEAIFGLRDAVDSFDPLRGVLFRTYAAQRLRGAILDYLRSIDPAPRLIRERERKVRQARERFQAVHGRQPDDNELAQELGVTADEYQRLIADSRLAGVTSLDTEMRTDPHALRDILADPRAACPSQETQRRDTREWMMRDLTRSERLILILYYAEGMTMKEIGLTLDLSESRVSQMHSLLIQRLRAKWSGWTRHKGDAPV